MQQAAAPWHIRQLFHEVDDQANAWHLLIKNILDELAPVKSMRVRNNDVPYTTSEWKRAIRVKRKAIFKYLKNKTQENWELRRKARNEATKQRRIAIKDYWRKKAKDLKTKPTDFFKTFKPFLSTEDCSRNAEVQLNTRSFNLKVSAGVRAGRQYGEYSLKINKVNKMKMKSGNLGG